MRNDCQLIHYQKVGQEPLHWFIRRRGRGARLRLNEWWRNLLGLLRESPPVEIQGSISRATTSAVEINTGDLVRVKSIEEIKQTLDANGFCRGCGFLEPMVRYCGQEVRVAKRVDQFFDEARWRMLKCRGIVLLEGIYCDGSGHPATIGCDRMCFFFWRTDWLEKVA
jgi:hypothetical protein